MTEDGWTVQPRYSLNCPQCGEEIEAAPSMAMGMGMNRGCGFHSCGASFRLHLTPGTWGKPISEQPTGMIATIVTEEGSAS